MPSTVAIDAAHWNIPTEWRAPAGAITPQGHFAQFRSAAHAVMAARVRYLNEHPAVGTEPVEEVAAHYQTSWNRFTAHCEHVVGVANHVANHDLGAAGEVWNRIDQPAANVAYTTMLGEREMIPGTQARRPNLSTEACKAYLPLSPYEECIADRDLKPADGNDAWDRANGLCVSCGTPTTRPSEHTKLRRVFAANPDIFNLTPTYIDTNDNEVPLWGSRGLIAAKGSPDHVVASCRGGPTTPDNLANTCSACQFARQHWTLDDLSVPAYGTLRPDLTAV